MWGKTQQAKPDQPMQSPKPFAGSCNLWSGLYARQFERENRT
jgi:hypothetical protein